MADLAKDVMSVGLDGGFVAALEWIPGPAETMFRFRFYRTVE